MPVNPVLTFAAFCAAVALYPARISQPVAEAAPITPQSAPHHIPMSDDRLYYVAATGGGAPIRMLVDSGANVTLLTRSDARRLGVAVDRLTYRPGLRTAKGSAALAFAELPALTIAGHSYRNVRVAVLEGGGGVSLLGQDMLSRFHITIGDGVMTLA